MIKRKERRRQVDPAESTKRPVLPESSQELARQLVIAAGRATRNVIGRAAGANPLDRLHLAESNGRQKAALAGRIIPIDLIVQYAAPGSVLRQAVEFNLG